MTTNATPRAVLLATGADAESLVERYHAVLETMGPIALVPAKSQPTGAAGNPGMNLSLNAAQTAFIITKLDTARALQRTALISEVFALFSTGRLMPCDASAAEELAAACAREGRPTT